MEGEGTAELSANAAEILKNNDRGRYTVPADVLYPHQWLWDSCFIAIGRRHLDVGRAQTELTSLLRGQWSNGMLPNMIFAGGKSERRERNLWRGWLSPFAPAGAITSGITQPPMLAEAVLQVGQKLKLPERRGWFKKMLPPLIRYHQWLYADRCPRQDGLIVLLHPYEAGLDNSPPWTSQISQYAMPLWLKIVEQLHLDFIVGLARRDTKTIPAGQRTTNIEALADWAILLKLRRRAYDSRAILAHRTLAVEDLSFNSIFIRANACLKEMAKIAGQPLPAGLTDNMARSETGLEELWDELSGQYFSRDFNNRKLIEEPSVASLLPLYAGSIAKDRAAQLVEQLKDRQTFSLSWPVPSVPRSSSYFNPSRYWQGPTWLNTNWLIIEGLRRYGYYAEAKILRQRTLELVKKSDFYEYYNPLTGRPLGAKNFSWTAALAIDLLQG